MGVPPMIVPEELHRYTVVQVIGEDKQYVKALERWHCCGQDPGWVGTFRVVTGRWKLILERRRRSPKEYRRKLEENMGKQTPRRKANLTSDCGL